MAERTAEVATLLEEWSEAIRRKDIERLMAVYSPHIVYFDVTPALRFVGIDAVRRNFERWFDIWQSPIGIELRDLTIAQSGELAAAHTLHRTSGRLKVGQDVNYWLRVSVICEKSAQGWGISHEHVSAPVDFAKRSLVLDAQP